jgi:glycosyltransferase involved in cell wall biosynthesis
MPGAGVKPHDIRVAVVIPTHWDYRMGGSQYQAKLLIEQLYEAYGATVTYFTARAGDTRRFADHRVVCVSRSNAPRQVVHFWDYFRLQKALAAFDPHVIYQRVGCAYTGISAIYAKRSGVPMIWHLASQKDCQKPPPISRVLGRPHVLIETRLAQRGVALADVVIAQSEDQVRKLHENFARQADRLIRNFHDVPPENDKHTGRFKVVWIGNLKPIKRPELLLEIASQLQGLPDIEFVVVGRPYSSESLQSRFEEKLKKLSNVRCLGAMPQEDVNKILERSDLLINTSKSEGFSNTFIQAWMRSVPVLTLGVNPDGLLTDSYLGSSHDSTAGIANTIRGLASNSDKLADMGKRSREFAIRQFSMANAAELADLIIQTAIDKRETSPETRKD